MYNLTERRENDSVGMVVWVEKSSRQNRLQTVLPDRSLDPLPDNVGANAAITIHLACGHTSLFMLPPKRNDVVFCLLCRAYQVVTSDPDEIRLRCRNCQLGRRYGRDNVTANRQAIQHARRYGHTAVLIEREIETEVTDMTDTLAIVETSE